MATDPEFVGHYLDELNHLRVEGTRFAKAYPQLAGGLDFQQEETADPQIARLVESFAFLSAKLQRQFRAQFPEIPTALLESLYPQLVAPVPSMAIAQVAVAAGQQRAIEGVTIPRGQALYATTTEGVECRFRTAAPLQLWPIAVEAAALVSTDAVGLGREGRGAEACLHLRLSCLGQRTFADMAPPLLRFYIDGDAATRFRLFEMLVSGARRIAIRTTEGAIPTEWPGLDLRHVGLEADEAALPWPEAGHQGYRLLQEYFAFPDKFMFVELTGLAPGMLGDGSHADLFVALDQEPVDRVAATAPVLRLNCVPIVNLFERTSDPIRLDHLHVDYTLEPDIGAAGSTEIHSILRVSRSADGSARADDVLPFFSAEPGAVAGGALRWYARRRRVANPALSGTEMQMAFVDPQMNPLVASAPDVLFARLLCTNRGLARQVTATTPLTMETDLPTAGIRCLARPTAQVDPPVAGENLWRLVSHLQLNRLSLDAHAPDAAAGAPRARALDALKEILFLYCGDVVTLRKRAQVDAIVRLDTRPIVRRLGDRRWRGFVRGTEIVATIDAERFVGGSALLFGAVLDRFFALYAGVNSFTEFVVRRPSEDKGRAGEDQHKDWKRWPARAGDRPVL